MSSHASFRTYFESLVNWTDGSGSAAYLTNGYAFQLSALDLHSGSEEGEVPSEEQYQKLQYYFQLYERYRLNSVHIRYVPRWNMVSPIYITTTNTPGECSFDICGGGMVEYPSSTPMIEPIFSFMTSQTDLITIPTSSATCTPIDVCMPAPPGFPAPSFSTSRSANIPLLCAFV